MSGISANVQKHVEVVKELTLEIRKLRQLMAGKNVLDCQQSAKPATLTNVQVNNTMHIINLL
jgi:hypothetical protein